ncbi:MAG: mercuric reductase [Acidobacteria bacterium]|nr:mercuric reductase [Acidobacteriota bacterium]
MFPDDPYNRILVGNTHPAGWLNPKPSGRYNLVVIGAGTAGLVSAAGAASLGARVALIEKHLMGGDCLNMGCVPSKGILRAARAFADVGAAGAFGVRVPAGAEVDFPAVMERMRRLRAQISPHDSVHRLTKLGVDVYLGAARFVGPRTVEVEGQRLDFARAVIATGARAVELPIPGLKEIGYLTNENLFWLTELPRRLIIVGAGPIGCEMAQAFRRFGSEVSIASLDPRLLPREDADASHVLQSQFEREGIRMRLGARILRAESCGEQKVIVFERQGRQEEVIGDAILVAIGRAPNVEGLDLDAAGVAFDRSGITVNERLQTTNKAIYAAGDVCSVYKFTHAADAMARVVLQNALFFGRKRATALVIPWCTFTDPEVAHVGLSGEEAERRGYVVETLTVELKDVDRAVLDGEEEGFARVWVQKGKDRILGATIVARHAGEMIGEVTLAMTAGIGLATLSRTIHPYPTQTEALKKLGDLYLRSRLTPRLRSWLAWYFRWIRRTTGRSKPLVTSVVESGAQIY